MISVQRGVVQLGVVQLGVVQTGVNRVEDIRKEELRRSQCRWADRDLCSCFLEYRVGWPASQRESFAFARSIGEPDTQECPIRLRLLILHLGNGISTTNGVGNSEMSIIWCISIPNNVKTCKKFNETAQTANLGVFTRGRRWRSGALC